MTESHVDAVAKAIYMTHWKQQRSGRYPPHWIDTSEEVKEFVRKQAQSALAAWEEWRILNPSEQCSMLPLSEEEFVASARSC